MISLFWQIVLAVVAMLVPNIGGFINGYLVTAPNIDSWYNFLNRPPFSPPNWLFTPVWIILYCAIGLGSFLVWRTSYLPLSKVSRTAFWWAIGVYAVQIAVNWVWVPVFFEVQDLLAALVVLVILDALSLINTILFWRINWIAGALFVPYLVWLSYATYLNVGFWQLNM